MPRSGSELLQCILHQNPRIYASTTSPVLEYIFAVRQNFDLPEVKSQDPVLMKEAFLEVCRGIPPAYYSKLTKAPVVVDKNRGWLHYKEWANQFVPNAKYICMVRDLRSIVASLERIYRSNRHSPQGIDNPHQLTNMTVWQRVDYWLNTQPVGLALLKTMDAFERRVTDDVLFIKYEDLCNNPEETMSKVYSYIDEPFFGHDFSNIEKQIKEDDSHFGIFGSHSVKPVIQPVKQNDWSDVLSDEVAEFVKQKALWYFSTFRY
jgi:sulfotransferase